jgi:hypothetical protein
MREIAEIELAMQGGTEKIEQLGEQGKVDEAKREMDAIEALKVEKSMKEVSSHFFAPKIRLGESNLLVCRKNSSS